MMRKTRRARWILPCMVALAVCFLMAAVPPPSAVRMAQALATSADAGGNRLMGQAGQWELVWNDEFDGTALDTAKWNIIEQKKGAFKSLQYYRPENVTVSGGMLHITARKQKYRGKAYTSGYVDTSGKFGFQYGKIEASIKIPVGYGYFPAFWIWQEDHGKPYQEIDVMENIGRRQKTIYSVHHFTKGKRVTSVFGTAKIKNLKAFHTYSLVWTKTELKSYMDGKLYFKTKKKIPREKMFVVLNLAVGGTWPKSPKKTTRFPGEFVIDYVRVYRYI
jgi:beta-glucanase (GH16 family)